MSVSTRDAFEESWASYENTCNVQSAAAKSAADQKTNGANGEEEVAGERGQVAFEAAPAVSAEELEALRRHARAVAEELSGGLPAAADVGVREITFLNMLEGLAAAALLPPESSEGHMCALLTFVQCFGRARGP